MIGSKRVKGSTEIPTGSMADVVFLLLIFFLVTTTMQKDKGLLMVLPPEGEAKQIPKKNICNISINPSGAVMIDEEIVTSREVNRIIKDKLRENPNLIVSIKANQDTEYNYFISVLDQVKKTGCEKISIANYER